MTTGFTEPVLRRRLVVHAAILTSTFVILGVTLVGRGDAPAHALCISCGDAWLADATMNTILFMPLGVALAAGGRAPSRAALIGLLISALIEITQYVTARGRFASPLDLLSNALGALLGALAWRTLVAWCHGHDTSRAHATVVASWWLACSTAAWGLHPFAPVARYEGQWARHLPGFAPFGGHIDSVSIGGLLVPDGPVQDAHRIAAIVAASGVHLGIHGTDLRAGTPLSQVGAIVYGSQRLASVSMAGCRLQGRIGTRAEHIGLGAPRIALEHACDSTGSPFSITLVQDGRRFQLAVVTATERAAVLPLRPVIAWVLLAPLVTGERDRRMITLVWIAGFGLLAGLLAGRHAARPWYHTMVTALLLLLGATVPGWAFGASQPSWAELLALLTTTAIGGAVAWLSAPGPRTSSSSR